MAIVSVENVERTYHQGAIEVPALRGVDLTIETGEFTALMGPSGSGKTTLLNLIGGLDVPDGGKVIVDGQPVGGMSKTERSRMRLHHLGFVFQSYNLIPVLSVYENTELVLLLQGVDAKVRREKVLKVLEEVGLKDLADRRPTEISGGQQQRVAVARAIVSEPALVLADEPTANLDSKTGESLIETMRHLNAEHGVTFVFATHDPKVMHGARRVVEMVDGQVAQDTVK